MHGCSEQDQYINIVERGDDDSLVVDSLMKETLNITDRSGKLLPLDFLYFLQK